MPDSRQQAYLDAMDIGVWHLREPHIPPGLKLGTGSGGVLLVCMADSESASRLANDINRALGDVPVWAWPHADDNAVELGDAIEEHLFTTVAIFGDQLAAQLFADAMPASLNAAKLVALPSMQDLQSQAGARRELWTILCRNGMVNAS